MRGGGALGRFSVLQIWPFFCSVFRFSNLKTAVFRFWCFARFAGFYNLVLGFLSIMMAVFRNFRSSAFYGFSGSPSQGSYTPQSR